MHKHIITYHPHLHGSPRLLPLRDSRESREINFAYLIKGVPPILPGRKAGGSILVFFSTALYRLKLQDSHCFIPERILRANTGLCTI